MDLGMPTLIACNTTEECAVLCHALELQFIELNMNLPQYQPGQINSRQLQAIAQKYGIYYTIHLDENLNVSDFNPYVAKAWQRTVTEAIQLAGEIGAPILNMHLPRGVYFTLPQHKVYLFEKYKVQYLESMRRFCDTCTEAAKQSDLHICIENSNGYTDFQTEALDILLKSPVFGLTLDIGHNHAIGGTDLPIILSRKDRLCHFHMHDAAEKRDHLALGDGQIDLDACFQLAKQCHARAVVETKTPQALKQSVHWLRRQNF